MPKTAILLTCHNRKEKTLRCLQSLFAALAEYGAVEGEIFLTDDGCTDGTAEAVLSLQSPKGGPSSLAGDWQSPTAASPSSLAGDCQSPTIHIVKGDGSLYWAGGMRTAWQTARKSGQWDYYLLLNDDTVLEGSAFETLFATQRYCREKYGREGIVSGITCATDDPTTVTYGGEVFISRLTCRRRMLGIADEPQLCDWTHANILLVPREVVEQQGILYEGYRHGQADLDYGYRARRRGIPVLVTASACGTCDFDHPDIGDIEERLCAMTLKERREYLNHPLHSDADYLTMIRRCMPAKYPLTWLFRKMNLYAPHLYYWLNKKR